MEKFKIHTIDLKFKGRPMGIASYLVEFNDGPIVIETGPHSTFPTLKEKIEKIGYRIEDIRHVFLTHIHLDHAGAAWCFAEKGSTIYLHPRGYKHMHDPSRLLASAQRIYKDEMESLWGTLKAINPDQLKMIEHLEVVDVLGYKLLAHHTPGHAQHHIAWQLNTHLFTGDIAGVSINSGPVIPPCPPPDIDLEAWMNSIDYLLSLDNVSEYFLGHFGRVSEPEIHMRKLKNTLGEYKEFIRPFAMENRTEEEIIPIFKSFVKSSLQEYGLTDQDATAYESANPSDMSVYGLMRYWKKKLGK